MEQRNAFEVIAETLSKTDYLESAKNLIGDANTEDTAMLYATIAIAEEMRNTRDAIEVFGRRIAVALEMLSACTNEEKGRYQVDVTNYIE